MRTLQEHKTWLSETGEHVGCTQGLGDRLAFSPELRVLFSCSIDGRILVWSKGDLLQKEKVGSGKGGDWRSGRGVKGGPLHCLAWDARRHSLVVGANGHIWVYSAIPETEMMPGVKIDHPLQSLLKDAHAALGPENALVRGIITTERRQDLLRRLRSPAVHVGHRLDADDRRGAEEVEEGRASTR